MFLTYPEYVSMGGSLLSEQAFNRYERKAEALINLMTHDRLKDESPIRQRVKFAVFDLVPLIALEAERAQSAGIKSLKNDGVSVSYAGGSAFRNIFHKLQLETVAGYLAYETVSINGQIVPLLYAGVDTDK